MIPYFHIVRLITISHPYRKYMLDKGPRLVFFNRKTLSPDKLQLITISCPISLAGRLVGLVCWDLENSAHL